LIGRTFFDDDGGALGCCFGDAQSQRAGEFTRFVVVAQGEERGVAFAGEAGEPNGDVAGEERCAVEDDEGEGAAAEEDIGAPGAAIGAIGADDPEVIGGARVEGIDVRPIARRECARGVDVGDAPSIADGAFDDVPDDGGLPGARRADEFSEPSAGESAEWEGGVEGTETGGQARGAGFGGVEDFGELEAEEGEGHGFRYLLEGGGRLLEIPNEYRRCKAQENPRLLADASFPRQLT
jgi:hypothetical protein